MKIVFFGTPEFAAYNLDKILAAGFDVAAVVTMPDKIAGRGHKLLQSDVKKTALAHNLPLLQPEKLKAPEFVEELRRIGADLFVVIAFRMLPEVVWGMPRLGTFNLHASLLPKYRGAAPINRAVMAGETKTGVTTFFLKHEIDTGDIIEQREIAILPEDNAGTVHDKLMELGGEMVVETLRKIEDGSVVSHPQNDTEATPAPKIFKEDCRINWNNPAALVHNQIRGLSPYPAAFTTFIYPGKGPLETKVFNSQFTIHNSQLNVGEVKVEKNRLLVGCGEGLLEILELQPSGKKRMTTEEFLRGYKDIKGEFYKFPVE